MTPTVGSSWQSRVDANSTSRLARWSGWVPQILRWWRFCWMMCRPIEGRAVQLHGYGVAFTKSFARRTSVNPVWYLDIHPGQRGMWLTRPIHQLIAEAEKAAAAVTGSIDPDRLAAASILRLTPFLEQMGPTNNGRSRKEFWWEREWRHVGDLDFMAQDIVVVFAPEMEHEAIRQCLEERESYRNMMPAVVDAQWGQERMIAAMAAIPNEDLGPFPRLLSR